MKRRRAVAALISILILVPAGAGSLLLGQAPAAPDEARVRWLAANGVPIRSADPADAEFSDLMPLKEAIGPARVVLLGEQSHGDGTTFLMKCRLVKFFHEVMGFEVLAWESGLYDCREMEAALHRDVPLQEAVLKGIFAIWGASRQVLPVFEYARSTYGGTTPLEMAGFDCQFSAAASRESFPAKIRRFLEAAGPSALSPEEAKLLPSALDLQALMKMKAEERRPYREFVGRLPRIIEANRPALLAAMSAAEIDFWDRSARNLKNLYEMIEVLAAGKLSKASDNNSRDRAMGETLVWLANERYRGRKIVVWAASFHNMWRGSEIETGVPGLDYKELRTMGDEVLERLGDEAYSIAFTAYQGKMGVAHRPAADAKDLEVPAPDSLEAAFHGTGNAFMFLDFRKLRNDPRNWIREGVVARPLGYSPMKTDWTRHFDAMVFTDVMVPSSRAEGQAPAPAPKSAERKGEKTR